MILTRSPEEVTTWMLAFQRQTAHWWMRLLPGEFKHVFAFAWVPRARVWVVYDVSLTHTRFVVLPEGDAVPTLLADWTTGSAILSMPTGRDAAVRFRVGFWCTIAMKHLLGLRSGALRPDALWRDCLRNGASIVHDGKPLHAEGPGAGPVAGPGAAAAGVPPRAAAAEG